MLRAFTTPACFRNVLSCRSSINRLPVCPPATTDHGRVLAHVKALRPATRGPVGAFDVGSARGVICSYRRRARWRFACTFLSV